MIQEEITEVPAGHWLTTQKVTQSNHFDFLSLDSFNAEKTFW